MPGRIDEPTYEFKRNEKPIFEIDVSDRAFNEFYLQLEAKNGLEQLEFEVHQKYPFFKFLYFEFQYGPLDKLTHDGKDIFWPHQPIERLVFRQSELARAAIKYRMFANKYKMPHIVTGWVIYSGDYIYDDGSFWEYRLGDVNVFLQGDIIFKKEFEDIVKHPDFIKFYDKIDGIHETEYYDKKRGIKK